MTRFKNRTPHGVIPAVLLPLHADFSIDEKSYRKHLRDVVAVEGISAIAVNGHSSEVHACTVDEQRKVLEITLDEIGDGCRSSPAFTPTAASKRHASPAWRRLVALRAFSSFPRRA